MTLSSLEGAKSVGAGGFIKLRFWWCMAMWVLAHSITTYHGNMWGACPHPAKLDFDNYFYDCSKLHIVFS